MPRSRLRLVGDDDEDLDDDDEEEDDLDDGAPFVAPRSRLRPMPAALRRKLGLVQRDFTFLRRWRWAHRIAGAIPDRLCDARVEGADVNGQPEVDHALRVRSARRKGRR